jgi:hypothetical protein
MPTDLLRRLANHVRNMRLTSPDEEPTDVVDELCQTAILCADMEERRGVDQLDDPGSAALLLDTFHELENRHGEAKKIPEIRDLLHRSRNAEPSFVAGMYAMLAALEKAKEEDEVDARLRLERAVGDRDTRNQH